MSNISNPHLDNINAYEKFVQIHQLDIERKHNFDIDQGPNLCNKLKTIVV